MDRRLTGHLLSRGKRGITTLITGGLAGLFTLFIAVPLLALLLSVPLETPVRAPSAPIVADALALSLSTATVSTLLVILFGTPLAYLNARHDYPGRALVEALTDLPIVLPPAVAGLSLLIAFGRHGLVGQYLEPLGITVAFTTVAVIMAQCFVAAPFYLRHARTSFAEVDPVYEAAARTLGASPLRVFLHITAPIATGGLISGAIMSFARALGDFGATIMFAGNLQGRTQTMPLAIYGEMQSDLGSSVSLALLLVAISFIVIAAVRGLSRRPARAQ